MNNSYKMNVLLRSKGLYFLLLLFFIFSFSMQGCKKRTKVLYVNSYHLGFSHSDDIMGAIEEGFSADSYALKTFFLNSKRNRSKLSISLKVDELMEVYNKFQPDIVITSDDNAIKYFVLPYLAHRDVPIVFCGVNLSADQYRLPDKNITGILEIWPIRESLEVIKKMYPEIDKLVILSENTLSELNNKTILTPLYKEMGFEPQYAMVDNFSQWKQEFKNASRQGALIYAHTNGGIKDWDVQNAGKFVYENIKTPVITSDKFMMPYSVFGMTKISREQGDLAVQIAKEILSGVDPSRISLRKNKKFQTLVNRKLADRINFKIDDDKLKIDFIN